MPAPVRERRTVTCAPRSFRVLAIRQIAACKEELSSVRRVEHGQPQSFSGCRMQVDENAASNFLIGSKAVASVCPCSPPG